MRPQRWKRGLFERRDTGDNGTALHSSSLGSADWAWTYKYRVSAWRRGDSGSVYRDNRLGLMTHFLCEVVVVVLIFEAVVSSLNALLRSTEFLASAPVASFRGEVLAPLTRFFVP